jgi:anti-sigma B factor antagonist
MQADAFTTIVDGCLVVVTGEVDLATAPRLHEALAAAATGGPLRVDLSEVVYLDSAAMAVLYRFTPQGLELVLVEGSVVERALDIGGLLDQVTVLRPATPQPT